mmetsp:Transcript_24221/g.74974  ORF Transcript_24221/g.74974 Transcript_24221/m.74974 type:complete len:290 (-) Transcript_24221:2262-3131(-)
MVGHSRRYSDWASRIADAQSMGTTRSGGIRCGGPVASSRACVVAMALPTKAAASATTATPASAKVTPVGIHSGPCTKATTPVSAPMPNATANVARTTAMPGKRVQISPSLKMRRDACVIQSSAAHATAATRALKRRRPSQSPRSSSFSASDAPFGAVVTTGGGAGVVVAAAVVVASVHDGASACVGGGGVAAGGVAGESSAEPRPPPATAPTRTTKVSSSSSASVHAKSSRSAGSEHPATATRRRRHDVTSVLKRCITRKLYVAQHEVHSSIGVEHEIHDMALNGDTTR